jgi:gamma-glutamylcyclotransferase (GGCT)/AIG2-like uncharacterized protein YtfP
MALPHVTLIDLFNNGIDYEVIVLKHNKVNGDVFFIRTDYLDDIDRNRAGMILSRRDAARYEAWDLFAQITLANGVNALEYFHQFVKVKTRSGEIMAPNLYRTGSVQRTRLNPDAQPMRQPVSQQAAQPPYGATEASAPAPRKAGRPPKSNKS